MAKSTARLYVFYGDGCEVFPSRADAEARIVELMDHYDCYIEDVNVVEGREPDIERTISIVLR